MSSYVSSAWNYVSSMWTGFNPTKFRTSIKLTNISINTQLSSKKGAIKSLEEECLKYMISGKEFDAKLAMEKILIERGKVQCLNVLREQVMILDARGKSVEESDQCPHFLKECLSTLIYAGSRLSEVRSLDDLNEQIELKFGKDFIKKHKTNEDMSVNLRVVDSLNQDLITGPAILENLKELAIKNQITWIPVDFTLYAWKSTSQSNPTWESAPANAPSLPAIPEKDNTIQRKKDLQTIYPKLSEEVQKNTMYPSTVGFTDLPNPTYQQSHIMSNSTYSNPRPSYNPNMAPSYASQHSSSYLPQNPPSYSPRSIPSIFPSVDPSSIYPNTVIDSQTEPNVQNYSSLSHDSGGNFYESSDYSSAVRTQQNIEEEVTNSEENRTFQDLISRFNRLKMTSGKNMMESSINNNSTFQFDEKSANEDSQNEEFVQPSSEIDDDIRRPELNEHLNIDYYSENNQYEQMKQPERMKQPEKSSLYNIDPTIDTLYPNIDAPSNDGKLGVGKALYSFEATEPLDLSCQEGDMFDILNKSDVGEGWLQCRCQITGNIGNLPANYLEITWN